MRLAVPILLLLAPALGGCVPMMAASAVGMAAQGAQGRPVSNEQLQPKARETCSAEAARYGAVHVIDVEQAAPDHADPLSRLPLLRPAAIRRLQASLCDASR